MSASGPIQSSHNHVHHACKFSVTRHAASEVVHQISEHCCVWHLEFLYEAPELNVRSCCFFVLLIPFFASLRSLQPVALLPIS